MKLNLALIFGLFLSNSAFGFGYPDLDYNQLKTTRVGLCKVRVEYLNTTANPMTDSGRAWIIDLYSSPGVLYRANIAMAGYQPSRFHITTDFRKLARTRITQQIVRVDQTGHQKVLDVRNPWPAVCHN